MSAGRTCSGAARGTTTRGSGLTTGIAVPSAARSAAEAVLSTGALATAEAPTPAEALAPAEALTTPGTLTTETAAGTEALPLIPAQ